MIIRFSIFLTLLALFYYYCKDDSANNLREPNDIKLIEVPEQISPVDHSKGLPGKPALSDSMRNNQLTKSFSPYMISVSQKY